MTTKVKNTVSHKTSQGDCKVTKGKLLLIYNEKYVPEVGMIGSTSVHPLFVWTQEHQNKFKKDLTGYTTKMVIPVIISETEVIEAGDAWINIKDTTLGIHESATEYDIETIQRKKAQSHCKKIIVKPTWFSPKHLHAIVEGKLKDGDELYVECGRFTHPMDYGVPEGLDEIKINPQGYVKLHRVEKKTIYTEREMLEKCLSFGQHILEQIEETKHLLEQVDIKNLQLIGELKAWDDKEKLKEKTI